MIRPRNKTLSGKPISKQSPHSKLEKDLEEVINHIVRIIDHDAPCIYGKINPITDACHVHSVGSNNSLRYHLFNIYGGSRLGNTLDDKLAMFTSLRIMYGEQHAEYVKYQLIQDYPIIKLSQSDLKQALTNAKEVKKELLEMTEIFTPERRIELRKEVNLQIGIYTK